LNLNKIKISHILPIVTHTLFPGLINFCLNYKIYIRIY